MSFTPESPLKEATNLSASPIQKSPSRTAKTKQVLVIFAVALVLLALTFFFWHISQGLALVLKA